jgi:hypothetical protein
VAVYVGANVLNMREAAVVRTFATQKLSFTANTAPSKGLSELTEERVAALSHAEFSSTVV